MRYLAHLRQVQRSKRILRNRKAKTHKQPTHTRGRNTVRGKLFISQTTLLMIANDLRAVVEVVPVVASANPVVVGSCVVGLVVGVGRLVEVLTSRGVLGGSSGVEAGGGLSVKGREHFVLRLLHCLEVEEEVALTHEAAVAASPTTGPPTPRRAAPHLGGTSIIMQQHVEATQK
jgi:hypothetical protein